MYRLFPSEPGYPPGFEYCPGFLSAAEEQALLAWASRVPTQPSRYGDYTALRCTANFRLGEAGPGEEGRVPAPELLEALAARVAKFAGRDISAFSHALLTEYPPGAPMGWHRDAPPQRVIYGVSLGAPCRFFLRPLSADPRQREAALLAAAGPALVAEPALGQAVARPALMARRAEPATIRLTLEPRSLYVIAGPARSVWQHSIPPVKALRYSITLRTL